MTDGISSVDAARKLALPTRSSIASFVPMPSRRACILRPRSRRSVNTASTPAECARRSAHSRPHAATRNGGSGPTFSPPPASRGTPRSSAPAWPTLGELHRELTFALRGRAQVHRITEYLRERHVRAGDHVAFHRLGVLNHAAPLVELDRSARPGIPRAPAPRRYDRLRRLRAACRGPLAARSSPLFRADRPDEHEPFQV